MCVVCIVIGLFANDVIIIGSERADWPAHVNVTIGNPRADKLGRNNMASNVSDSVVKLTEKDVSWQRLCTALSRITICFSYNDDCSVEE